MEEVKLEHRIGAALGLVLGRNPAVTAPKVAPFREVEVELVEGIVTV